MADDPSGERDDEAVDLDVLELEREAAAMEAAARARRGLPGARRLLLLQAPLLVLLAVGLIIWGQAAPSATASAAPPRLSLAEGHLDPPAANATAAYAYVDLRNDGGSPERLVGGGSPRAATGSSSRRSSGCPRRATASSWTWLSRTPAPSTPSTRSVRRAASASRA